MFKKLYSPIVLLSAVSLVPVAQGMERMSSQEIEMKRIRISSMRAKQCAKKLKPMHGELIKAFDRREEKLEEIRNNKDKYSLVVFELVDFNPGFEHFNFEAVEKQREDAWRDFCVTEMLAKMKEDLDLKEESDLAEMPEAFELIFAKKEESKDQNVVAQELFQSLAVMEDLQNQEEAALQEATDEAINPVKTVGFFQRVASVVQDASTAAKDLIFGASNVAYDLSNNMPAERLEDENVQARINRMVSWYVPEGKGRNDANLKALIKVYTALAKLDNKKVMNPEINAKIYNACVQWRQEVEKAFTEERDKAVIEIAKLVTVELAAMVKKQEPSNALLMLIGEVEELIEQTGMFVRDEKVATQETEPKVAGILKTLEILSLELQAEKLEKEIAEAQAQ